MSITDLEDLNTWNAHRGVYVPKPIDAMDVEPSRLENMAWNILLTGASLLAVVFICGHQIFTRAFGGSDLW